jgi:imidazolonepropionase-like amidohydrolase
MSNIRHYSILDIIIICTLVVLNFLFSIVTCSKKSDTIEVQFESSFVTFINTNIIDGTGAEPFKNGILVVKDGIIEAIGSNSSIQIPPGSRIIDAANCTILPGFINTHVHNALDENNLTIWAQYRITTVRELGTIAPLSYGISTRDSYSKNPYNSRLVFSGRFLTVPNGYPIRPNGVESTIITSVDEAAQKTLEEINAGVDNIKIMLDDYDGSYPTLNLEQTNAIANIAHSHGLHVSAHITKSSFLNYIFSAGVDDIVHSITDTLNDETINEIVKRNIYITPTLHIQNPIKRPQIGTNLHRFIQLGGKVAMGNDVGSKDYDFLEYGMPITEIENMQKAGMTPMEIIVSATMNAAMVCRLGNKLGTLVKGKTADLIIIDGNPLEDIHNLKNVMLVMRDGVIIKNLLK